MSLLGVLWIATLVVMALLWPVVRLAFIPLGQVKLAFWASLFARPSLARDQTGRAVLAGALALYRRAKLDLALVAWLEERLAAPAPLGGAGVCAAGLLRAARGDEDGARALLVSVRWLHRAVTPRIALAVSGEWITADAANRGDWARVRSSPRPRTRTVRWLALAAAQRLGRPIAAWRLRLAPRALRPLFAAEPARQPGSPPAAVGATPYRTPGVPVEDLLGSALRAHAAVAATPSAERVNEAAAAWDRALADPALAVWAAERADALGARVKAMPELGDAIAEDLAEAAMACGATLAANDGPTAARAARLVRERLLTDVEAAAAALVRRIDEGRALPPIDDWRELVSLRLRHARAIGLGDALARHFLFPRVHVAACPLAVRLWNGGAQRPLANAVFTWLLREAEAASHETLAAHERQNVSCGLG